MEGDATLLVLFGKHNLHAKNTIHKAVVLVLKKCVKQNVENLWTRINPQMRKEATQNLCYFQFCITFDVILTLHRRYYVEIKCQLDATDEFFNCRS
jgi:hypothetical protein